MSEKCAANLAEHQPLASPALPNLVRTWSLAPRQPDSVFRRAVQLLQRLRVSHCSWMIVCFLLGYKGYGRMTQWCSQLLRAWGRLMTGCWLGVLDRKTLQRIDQFYYEERSMYADPDYNRSGLMDWEQQAVQTHFQKCKRLLLIGAGGGREVLALHRLGYEVDAYECHPKLLAAAQRLCQEEGTVATVRFAPRDQAIASNVTYDGAVIGWGAYTLIQGRARRTALLSAVRQQLADDAPLLVSFFMRSENDRSYRFITRTANTIRQMLRRPDCIELGDDLVYNFVHCFLSAEVESELREGGLQPVEIISQGASGYAVGRVMAEHGVARQLQANMANRHTSFVDNTTELTGAKSVVT